MRRLGLLAFMVVSVALPPGEGRAEPGPGPVSGANRRAQAYIDLATTFFEERNFAQALAELAKADPLLEGDPGQATIRFNMARCYEEMQRPVEAVAAYERYLAGPDSGPRRARAEAALARLRATHYGRLVVRCVPIDAELSLESPAGRRPARCPFDEELLAGHYRLSARMPGFASESKAIEVRPGQLHEERVVLERQSVVTFAPSARPATSRRVDSDADDRGNPWLWAAFGLGGLATIGGVGLHIATVDSRDTAEATAPGSTERSDANSEFETLQIATITAYGVGAVGLGLGLWLALRSDETNRTSGIIPTSNGVVVRF